jgi:hypothetical protein
MPDYNLQSAAGTPGAVMGPGFAAPPSGFLPDASNQKDCA